MSGRRVEEWEESLRGLNRHEMSADWANAARATRDLMPDLSTFDEARRLGGLMTTAQQVDALGYLAHESALQRLSREAIRSVYSESQVSALARSFGGEALAHGIEEHVSSLAQLRSGFRDYFGNQAGALEAVSQFRRAKQEASGVVDALRRELGGLDQSMFGHAGHALHQSHVSGVDTHAFDALRGTYRSMDSHLQAVREAVYGGFDPTRSWVDAHVGRSGFAGASPWANVLADRDRDQAYARSITREVIDANPRTPVEVVDQEGSLRARRMHLLDTLKVMSPAMFEEVLFRLDIPDEDLPPRTDAQAVRVIAAIRWSIRHRRLDMLELAVQETLEDAQEREAAWSNAKSSSEHRRRTVGPLERLRNALAAIWHTPTMIRMVLADIELNASRIELQGTAEVMWFSVLEEADRYGRVAAIFEYMLERYPAHPGLQSLQGLPFAR